MNATLSSGLFFLAGLIIGALAATWYFAPQALMPLPQVSTEATTSLSIPSASGDVAVSNQAAGNSVVVDSVTVAPPGVWVAVQVVNQDGTLGNVLGAEKVGGPRSDISVQLLRATIPHTTYAIVLYRDDGDGQFEVGEDSVYVDFDTGEPVEALFQTN